LSAAKTSLCKTVKSLKINTIAMFIFYFNRICVKNIVELNGQNKLFLNK